MFWGFHSNFGTQKNHAITTFVDSVHVCSESDPWIDHIAQQIPPGCLKWSKYSIQAMVLLWPTDDTAIRISSSSSSKQSIFRSYRLQRSLWAALLSRSNFSGSDVYASVKLPTYSGMLIGTLTPAFRWSCIHIVSNRRFGKIAYKYKLIWKSHSTIIPSNSKKSNAISNKRIMSIWIKYWFGILSHPCKLYILCGAVRREEWTINETS